MTDTAANRYDSRNIKMMELVYGKGYLSAGGDEEVARIVSAVTIEGKGVLDIGCGLGGAAVTLVRDHRARHVHGLDIDSRVIERAVELVEAAGIAEQVTLTQFGGGVLPYADDSFEVVYVTATTCHLEDLAGFFRESYRVLRAGGWIVGGEWFKAADNAAFKCWDSLLREQGLNFHFVSRQQFETALSTSGFEQVSAVNRTQATSELTRDYLRRVETDLRGELLAKLGAEGLDSFLAWTRSRYDALANGGMYYGHFRARKLAT